MTAALRNPNAPKTVLTEYLVPILSGLLIVFGAVHPILTVACLLMNGVYMVFAGPKAAWKLMFGLLPFAQVYKVVAFGGTSFYTFLEVLLIVMFLLRVKEVERKFLIPFVLWIVYVLLGSGMNLLMWIKQLMIPMLIYIFFRSERPSYKELIVSLSLGLILSSVLALFAFQIPELLEMMNLSRLWEAEGLVYRFTGLYRDPNYYTMVIILCVVSMMTLFASRRMGVEALILSGVLIYFGARTASKSFILMLVVVAVMFVVCMFVNKRHVGATLALTAAALAGVAVSAGKLDVFTGVLMRLQSGAGDLTTGRVYTWGQYFRHFGENGFRLLFGSGMQAGFLDGVAAHNTYIDLLYFYGIVGTALFLLTCIRAVGIRHHRVRLANILPLVCLMIMIMFLSSLDLFDFPFNLMLVLFALQEDFTCLPKREHVSRRRGRNAMPVRLKMGFNR